MTSPTLPIFVSPHLKHGRVRKWKSGEHERLVILWVRLPPRSLTTDPVVKRRRHLRDMQETMVQLHPGSLETKRAARPTGGRLACNQEIGVRLPGGPLETRSHGPTGQHRPGVAVAFISEQGGFDSR